MSLTTASTAPPIVYTDRKKALWLLSVFAPMLGPLGPYLYLQTGQTQWLWVFLAFFYLGLPVFDAVFGEDRQNPPEAAVPALEQDRFYRYTTYGRTPAVEVVIDSDAVSGTTTLVDLGPAVSVLPQTAKCTDLEDVFSGN